MESRQPISYPLTDTLLVNRQLMRRAPRPLRGAVRLLRRATGRRMRMRERSVRVRENAVEELEVRQRYWAYSKPAIMLDMVWNLTSVVVGLAVLGLSVAEKPVAPLRVWVSGYILACVVHVGCVVSEYQRRSRLGLVEVEGWWSGESDDGEYGGAVVGNMDDDDDDRSVAKTLEGAVSMFAYFWWLAGFYWVTGGGQTLISDSPRLYWLCVAFLAFDVVFVLVCVSGACLVGFGICCCLPCMIAILCVVTEHGATQEEIDSLPKFKFRRTGDLGKVNGEAQASEGMMTECGTNSPNEHAVSQVDAECPICLTAYDNGAELLELPCEHHFHSTCIDKWLRIKATCPLCKFNIIEPCKGSGARLV